MTDPTTPTLTKCGLPYGGCSLCNPEQFDVVMAERAEREALKARHLRQQRSPRPADVPPPTIGDFRSSCPPEYSKSSALATAVSMADRHGVVVAMKKASRFRLQYLEESWGRKHWDMVVKRLRAQL